MSANKNKKRKQKKARSTIVLQMLLNCKGGPMKDRREKRKNSKNRQEDYNNDDWE